jgi:GT2 family glycosyltransferase
MAEQTNLSYAGRTLVVMLCMHRSGSSLVTSLFQRLGMSLGPFELLGPNAHNQHGHFEAMPGYRLDQELLTQVFGFSEDIPTSPEVLRRFLACQGQWQWQPSLVSPQQEQRGRDFIAGLAAAAPVSGFKDPRVPLLWPFWQRIFSQFDGLRVVPVFLLRSPHEIAMSIFARSQGELGYHDALDVTALHYERLGGIFDAWKGDRAVVRFDPRVFTADLRRAVEVCGLPWSDDALAQVYDAACKHQEPATVAHRAEELFRRLSDTPANEYEPANLRHLESDAATRENVLRGRLNRMREDVCALTQTAEQERQMLAQMRDEVGSLTQMAERSRQEAEQSRQAAEQSRQAAEQSRQATEQSRQQAELSGQELERSRQEVEQYRQENVRYAEAELRDANKINLLEARLTKITGSRTWRLRQRLVSAVQCIPGLRNWRREVLPKEEADEERLPRWAAIARAPLSPGQAGGLPKVTVVIVNYNGLEHLPGCLKSLFATDYPHFDVTLVDNGSTDGSRQWVQSRYPRVKVIASPRNVGFGRANQLAISASDAPVIALLNNDTVVERGWLRALVEPLLADEHVAATSSKLRFLGDQRTLNGVGGGMNYLGFSYDLGMYERDCGQRDEPREVLFPCGAACAIKRSVFDEARGFDDQFFMYHEDVDLGWRLHLLGYSVLTAPRSVVYHRFGGTSRRSASAFFRERLGLRHDLRSLLKNYEWSTLLRVLPDFLLRLLKLAWTTRSCRFFHCLGWNLWHLPSTLRERRIVQRCRRASDGQLAALIVPHARVPCCEPDYTPIDRAAFLLSDCKKSWIDLGDRRWNVLGHGWYVLEAYWADPRIRYRWTQREAVVYLWQHFARGTLELDVLGSAVAAGRSRVCYVSVNGRPAGRFELKTDDWETVRLDLAGPPGPLEITIRTEETWSPHLLAHNGDDRELGIGVKRVHLRPAAEPSRTWDGISVIIPTYNRCRKLAKVLAALEAQTLDKRHFEVIVVDDGSTDATQAQMADYQKRSPLRLRYVRQQNKLQGAARNYGITLAEEPLVLFMGDDIIPGSDFLQEHLDFHRRHNPTGDAVVVGKIRWPKELRATPFMQFVNDEGAQFGFAAMDHPGPWQFDCFYTSNISVPRRMLLQLDHVFDEDFKTYGWEDTELGYRLERNGMRLLYNSASLADHDHPTDLVQFCRRQHQVGMCSRVFLAKHPELEAHLGSIVQMRRRASAAMPWRALAPLAGWLDRRLRLRLPYRWYWAFLATSYARGVVHGEKTFRPQLCRSYLWRVSAADEWSLSEAEAPCENREDGQAVVVENAGEDRLPCSG